MPDIAHLGLTIDSKGIVRATDKLKELEKQSGETERATDDLVDSTKKLNETGRDSKGVVHGTDALKKFEGQAGETETATDNLKNSTKRLTKAASDHRRQLVSDIKTWKSADDPARKYRLEIKRVDAALRKGIISEKLAISTKKRLTASIEKEARSVGKLRKKLDGATSNLTKFAAAAAVASAVLASAKLISVARSFDVINASLETVTGSTEAAKKAFEIIREFAAETPFDLQQVANAFIKMKAFGLDPSMAALESYGNTASAMGKSLNQMIEAVADAATNEFERLKEFGIKARQSKDSVAFTFKGITTTVGKNSEEIQGYLRSIGDVDFAGAMDRRAKTLDGALSNLGDSWDNLFLTISNAGVGKLIADVSRELSHLLDVASDWFKEIPEETELLIRLTDQYYAQQQSIERHIKLHGENSKAVARERKELEEIEGKIDAITDAYIRADEEQTRITEGEKESKKVLIAKQEAAALAEIQHQSLIDSMQIKADTIESEQNFLAAMLQSNKDAMLTEEELAQVQFERALERVALSRQLLIEGGLSELEAEAEIRAAKEALTEASEKKIADIKAKYQTQAQKFGLAVMNGEIKNVVDGLSGLTSILASSNKKMFNANKMFATGQVLINGIQQVSEAAKLPYPANIPAVAFAVADSGMRLAAIKSSSFGGGSIPSSSPSMPESQAVDSPGAGVKQQMGMKLDINFKIDGTTDLSDEAMQSIAEKFTESFMPQFQEALDRGMGNGLSA